MQALGIYDTMQFIKPGLASYYDCTGGSLYGLLFSLLPVRRKHEAVLPIQGR